MDKLPVFKIFGRATAFPFREFSAVVRLTWLPLLILTAATYYFGVSMENWPGMMEPTGTNGPPEIPADTYLAQLGFLLVYLVIDAVVAAVLYRVILFSERRQGTYVYFQFGKAELLLVLAPIVLALVLIPIGGVFVAFAAIVGASLPAPVSDYAVQSVPAVVALLLLPLLIRMSLWGPTIVTQNRLAFFDAFGITKGNFFRLLGLFLLSAIGFWFVYVAGFVALAKLYGQELGELFSPATTVDAGSLFAFFAKIDEFEQKHAIAFNSFYFVLNVFVTAVGTALIGYSYESLEGKTAEEQAEQFA